MTCNTLRPRPIFYLLVSLVFISFHGCITDEVDNGPECFSSIETLDASGVDINKATLNAAYSLSARQGTTITDAGFAIAKKPEEVKAADMEWNNYEAIKVSTDSLLLDLTDLEPETAYIYLAYIRTNNDKGTINGEYKYFTTGALPQISTVITEGVTKQGDHLYSLHGSYNLASKHILSGMGFKYWITSDQETVFDQEEAIATEEGEQFTEQITVSVLDVRYFYHAYITIEGSSELILGDTLEFTPNSQTVVTTDKYEITAPGIVELHGSYILGGNSIGRETGFYLWKNEELLGNYPTDALSDNGSIYLETDFIDYENAFYQFMAYLKHTDNTEITGEKLDILFTSPGIPISEKPTIDDVYDTDTEVTGMGIAGSDIQVIFPSGTVLSALVDKNNKWRCNVPASEALAAGQIVKANQTEPDKQPSDYIFTIVLARGIPEPEKAQSRSPIINDIYNDDIEITGTGVPQANVTVIFPRGTEVPVTVENNGSWKCNVPAGEPLATDQTIQAYQIEHGKLASLIIDTTVLERDKSKIPEIDEVYTTDTEITGRGIPWSDITVLFEDNTKVLTKVDQNGIWRITYPFPVTLVVDEKIRAFQTEVDKLSSEIVETTIQELAQEKSAPPHINDVYHDDDIITGTGIAWSEITLTFPDGSVETFRVNSEGKWSCTVPGTLNIEDLISANQTETEKLVSDEVTTVVLERVIIVEKSALPTIDYIQSGSSTVTGEGVAGSQIKVKFSNNKVETAVVNENGRWIVNVPSGFRLYGGDIVIVTQTEENKLESDPETKVVIQIA